MRDAGGGISGVYDAGDCTGILRMAGKGSQRRALAEVIREAFADPETLRGKGRTCRKWVEETFSEEEMLGRFEEVYEKQRLSRMRTV